ncbi:unnamed protein product [Paramecium sonneborni]|uniref:Uncharacterized protein n=1 Tax=Paramecium sonneborni TaxID=65129 RepID=A0A8S1MEV5_9CILI|nr:unnamed protein product [Paramecium sonneborni]
MNNEEAIQILLLKSEQQVKTINMLNSQLEISNNEKSELRLQIIALQNDNMTLRREKDGLYFQIKQLQKQLANQDQNKDIQIGQENKPGQVFKQEIPKFNISKQKQEFIEQEHKRLLDENGKLLQEIQDFQGQLQSKSLIIEQLQHQIQEIQNEINFKEALIKKKDYHILEYEKKITNIQDVHQEKLNGLQYQLQKMRDYMLQSYQENGSDNQNNQAIFSKLIQNTGNVEQNANKILINDQQQIQQPQHSIPQLSQLPLSAERYNTEINELQAQSSGRHHIKQSTNNPGQMRQSNEQNTFQLNTVQSEFSNQSQPKVSERFKNSDYN